MDELDFDTLAIRAGGYRTQEGEHSEAIFPTSSFVFDSAAEAAARFAGDTVGNIYSRFTNPTVRVFEERLAAMEGGEVGVATASGMSAILATCMGLLRQGDHIVSSRSIFGSTTMLFNRYLSKFGITTRYATLTDLEDWERVALQRAVEEDSHYYVLEFSNLGGLVMPILLELKFADGSSERYDIPAEIWRRNHQQVIIVNPGFKFRGNGSYAEHGLHGQCL